MKLSIDQQADLDVLAEIHTEVVDAKRVMEKRIREQFEREFEALLRRQSKQANRCIAQGIPKTKVGRALGTSDWGTIAGVLSLTREEIRQDEQVAVANTVEGPNGDWTYHPDTKILVVHHWRENGTMGRWRQDDLELQMKDTDHGTLTFTEYGDDITRRTKLEVHSVGEFENAVNVAMGFRKPEVDDHYADPRDDFWASYSQNEADEDVETEA